MLTEKAARFFDAGVRARGQTYFEAGRVRLMDVHPFGRVRAAVQGTRGYETGVIVECEGRVCNVDVSCTCPYGEEYGALCKHIWATLLAIEKSCEFATPLRRVIVNEMYEGQLEDFEELVEAGEFGTNVLVSSADVPESTKRSSKSTAGRRSAAPPRPPEWLTVFQHLADSGSRFNAVRRLPASDGPLEPMYILDPAQCRARNTLYFGLGHQTLTQTGRPGKVKRLTMTRADISRIESPRDRDVCLRLLGATDDEAYHPYYQYGGYDGRRTQSQVAIPAKLHAAVLPALFETGRVYVRSEQRNTEIAPLAWDDGPPWEFTIGFDDLNEAGQFRLSARFQRESEILPLKDAELLVRGEPSLFLRQGRLHPFIDHDCFDWAVALRDRQPVAVPNADRDKVLKTMSAMNRLPRIDWPDAWGVAQVRDLAPRPELTLHSSSGTGAWQRDQVSAEVRFHYDGTAVMAGSNGAFITDAAGRRQVWRKPEVERQLMNRVGALGLQPDPYDPGRLRVHMKKLPGLVSALLREDWTVLGDKKLYRRPGEISVQVASGIDWFELTGTFNFDGQSATLPELLAALRKGEQFVRLGDGSLGMLPEEWLARNGALLELGRLEEGGVRFAKTQVGLLDALLAEMPDASFDANFTAARRRLSEFAGVQARSEPLGFQGELRPYQKLGVGWLEFLHGFEWGGCLADDMGLGKTIQVLALIAARREAGERGPCLTVVPKSLIFNWMRESARFTPALRVLDYTGLDRASLRADLARTDLVLTTYGTLRRDVEILRKHEFAYVILDEAQAIKNPKSQNAKAARLLRARQRLVMTGTPVENQIGDLWSLMDFLNPGMLGGTEAFRSAFVAGRDDGAEPGRLPMLQRMLRPFILRRTKEQVAPELPARSEQTFECEMSEKQAAYYNELRDHYRTSLLARVDKLGIKRSKIHVLEALLRLRQAACHPGLIDRSKLGVDSGKLDALLPMLDELLAEKHKALIFSQFTSMLAIVRERLDARNIPYEYLDGQTRDRSACVDRFQSDAACPLFLISLKAGGVGLNLTSADYVFILDPWWNPAVEAQAIDRTHRIGQDKRVIAYRLLSRGTVESKVLELQKSKRRLAEQIITEDNSLIQDLTVDDLKQLLS